MVIFENSCCEGILHSLMQNVIFRKLLYQSLKEHVVGKDSWKDREVREFLVEKFFPSSALYIGNRSVGKFSSTKNFPASRSFQPPFQLHACRNTMKLPKELHEQLTVRSRLWIPNLGSALGYSDVDYNVLVAILCRWRLSVSDICHQHLLSSD